jgi:glyoxylase-like metal-dependent hydrolase (beta-lactamase superfamily II)
MVRKSSVVRLCALALLGGGLWLAHTQQGGGRGPQPAKLDTVKLKDDLYVIHNDVVPGNTTALVTNEGVVLVDDKFEVDHDNIMAELKKVTNQPVKYVVNTHHHGDHTGGNAKMQQMNVQIIASENARENMVFAKQPGMPNITVEQRGHVYLGGKEVDMYYFGRSHTNGDIVVYFPADRVLAAGDMFTFGDATPELIDYSGGGSGKEWPKTLSGALQLDFDTVVPGHGNVATKADMAKFRDTTISVNNRIHEMLQQKKNKDEIGKVMQSEFHWGQLQLARSLDGAMVELQ